MNLFFADLHLHSKYSRAVSKDMDLPHLVQGAKQKGLSLMGTGDFSHPAWLHYLKHELLESGLQGLYEKDGVHFMLSNEVATFCPGHKVHHCVFAPSFECVDQLTDVYSRKSNLAADGRPMMASTTPAEFVELTLEACSKAVIIPAHAWTPWFGVLGSKSGYDSVQEAYEDKSSKIFAIETGLSCYDSKTEVLTEKGWKKFSEVNYSDKICTINPKTSAVEYQRPNKKFRYHYRGKMYKLKTRRVDLLVTPNHRLFVTTCDFRNPKPFFLKEAEFLYGKSKQFKKDGLWRGEDKIYFVLPSVSIRHGSKYYRGFRKKQAKKIPMHNWLKFFGFWIAEGWVSEGKNGDYGVYLCNTNGKLIREMNKILTGFGYRTFYSKKTYTLRVRDYQLFNYLKQFGKCYEKFIPLSIKKLSKKLLQIFLDYYIKGDGHIYGRNGKGLSATTTSVKLRDDLQEIALKVGMSAYYKLGQKRGTPIPHHNQKKSYLQRNDSWVVYFIRRNRHALTPSYLKKKGYVEEWVDFNGFVYCVSVPNKVIYVRRNGTPVWCGNSDPAMNWRVSSLDDYALMSNSDSHSPAPLRIGREANCFNKPMGYDALFDSVRKKDAKRFLFTVEVDPAYGKYHYDGHRNCNYSRAPDLKNKACPKCGKELTIGVEHRVEELADRPQGFKPKDAIPFKRLLPLQDIAANVFGTAAFSKQARDAACQLSGKFGNELTVLLETPFAELEKECDKNLVGAIKLNREERIKVKPGFDGVYGVPDLSGQGKITDF